MNNQEILDELKTVLTNLTELEEVAITGLTSVKQQIQRTDRSKYDLNQFLDFQSTYHEFLGVHRELLSLVESLFD